MAVEIQSMRAKESVSMRATTAGITTAAAMRVTPSTFMLARIAKLSRPMSKASVRATLTPDTSATSGSKVVKSSWR